MVNTWSSARHRGFDSLRPLPIQHQSKGVMIENHHITRYRRIVTQLPHPPMQGVRDFQVKPNRRLPGENDLVAFPGELLRSQDVTGKLVELCGLAIEVLQVDSDRSHFFLFPVSPVPTSVQIFITERILSIL